jgi:DNA-binding GntR family transcriptional regulator
MGKGLDPLERYLEAQPSEQGGVTRRLRDVAYSRLSDALHHIDLEPGTPLPEITLSQLLNISRTPVREALQELAKDGLIQMVNGRALTLPTPTAQELFDALRVREMLEPEVVRLAATHMPPAELETLQGLTDQMEAAAQQGDRPAWSNADRAWHEVLSYACPNKLLGQMVLQARYGMYRRGSDEQVPDQFLIDGTREHRLVVEAIAAKDGTLAAERMLEHLANVRQNMFRRLIRQ